MIFENYRITISNISFISEVSLYKGIIKIANLQEKKRF